MAKAKQMLYTQEGYDALVEELNYLKNIRREEIKNDIAVARSFGDLSENAEYDAARNAQAENEARILQLKADIENAEVMDASAFVKGVVNIGTTVKVIDKNKDKEMTFRIVGSNEADVVAGKISDISPVGRALIGHKKGEIVTDTVEASNFTFTYEIVEVTRD